MLDKIALRFSTNSDVVQHCIFLKRNQLYKRGGCWEDPYMFWLIHSGSLPETININYFRTGICFQDKWLQIKRRRHVLSFYISLNTCDVNSLSQLLNVKLKWRWSTSVVPVGSRKFCIISKTHLGNSHH